MTRVLPLPAPARISSGPSAVSTASRCSGFRCSRKDKAEVTPKFLAQFYRGIGGQTLPHNFCASAVISFVLLTESRWAMSRTAFKLVGRALLPAMGCALWLGRNSMSPTVGQKISSKIFLALGVVVVVGGLVVCDQRNARAGEVTPTPGYKVLDPIRHGNLTVFPVVAAKSYPTGEFLTLDEGLRSGEVVVTEAGSVQGLIRRHPTPGIRHDGAQVNRLVLVNNSKQPLLLLAGEIVTGGKQDRVIGKDRIVPPESDPVDLSVFCVEPGRWVATSEHFGASGAMYGKAVGGPVPAPM